MSPKLPPSLGPASRTLALLYGYVADPSVRTRCPPIDDVSISSKQVACAIAIFSDDQERAIFSDDQERAKRVGPIPHGEDDSLPALATG